MTNLRLLLTPLLFTFTYGGKIEICVKSKRAGVARALSGATVQCYDEDLDADDHMASGTTGSDGCVTLTYSTKNPSFWNPCAAWDCPLYTNPDIYCKISGPGYYPMFTNTKEDHSQSNTANFGTVNIYQKRRCWKEKDFGGQTCSKAERITKRSTTLDECKTACELDSECEFIYWQSDDDRPAHNTPLCHMYSSCDSKRTPASGGVNYQVDDCSGMANGCGPSTAWDSANVIIDEVTGFEDQCQNHDLCYLACDETQSSCDDEFYDMMKSECNDRESTENKSSCKAVALALYEAVKAFGADPYFDAQDDGGCFGS